MQWETYSNQYPTNVEVESTSKCNINPPCPMCDRAYRDPSTELDIPTYLIDWIKKPIVHAKFVGIHGVGEPTISPAFHDLINMCTKNVSFSTNGLVMTDKHIDTIVNKPVHRINVSIDAASELTYKKLRGINDNSFHIVKNNIKKLIKNKKEAQPYVYLAFVIMKENYKEIIDLVHLAKDLECDGVNIWHVNNVDYKNGAKRYDYDWIPEDQKEYPKEVVASMIDQAKEDSNMFNIHFEYKNDGIRENA